MTVGLVLVSHSALLAAGLVEVAAQMAPDVALRGAGGTEDGRVGTGFALVEAAIAAVLDGGSEGVAVLYDLGSALMTAESVIEILDDERVRIVPGALVEGAVAGAVAAQGGADLAQVAARIAEATRQVAQEATDGARETAATVDVERRPTNETGPPGVVRAQVGEDQVLRRTLTLLNPLGLHARPAALLSRVAGQHDATVLVQGADAASLLSLMALALPGGAEVEITASGPAAQQALDAVAEEFERGFGELDSDVAGSLPG